MLLNPAEGTAWQSVQVLPPGLVLDHAWSRETVVPRAPWCPKYGWCCDVRVSSRQWRLHINRVPMAMRAATKD
ncbi:hypothetical protein Acr_24g0009980 [Actinidia rufa]|uniref:Uncharacterized protein n=1 Tax=Actinidia rufa TaxID=165716 RepID=A0A7J0GVL5_9ERIC|nr:hypothetical protein Acr_24g0009980 [Actinidia rufa]